MKNWKNLCLCFAAFLCLVLLAVPIANAETTTGDEVLTHVVYRDLEKYLAFHYTVNNGEATVVSYSFRNTIDDYLGSLSIPDTVGGYPVTAIGERAFANEELYGIAIPNGVTIIGDEAFSGCSELDHFTIPDSVTTIGNAAFSNCSMLMTLTMSDSVTTIGDNAFFGCSELSEVYYEGTQAKWNQVEIGSGNECLLECMPQDGESGEGDEDPETPLPETTLYKYTVTDGKATITACDDSVSGDLVIPSSLGGYPVTVIGEGAFTDCNNIESVTIPDSVVTIDDYAFYACRKLRTVKMGAGVTRIGVEAFSEIDQLTTVIMGDNVATIGDYAFYCSNITTITIPASVTTIGDYAFEFCDSLSEVVYKGTKEQWDKINVDEELNYYLFQATIRYQPSGNQIITHPASVTAQSGTVARFAVEAYGDVQSYVWQYKKENKWFITRMEGWNTNTLYVDATGNRNGYGYRCTVTYADGTQEISESAELVVETAITIQTQPKDQGTVPGGKALFSVSAAGEFLRYQWQYNADGQWTDVSGARARTLLVKDTVENRTCQYRCKITDAAGLLTYTDAVALRILSVAQQPETTTALLNKSATFTVVLNDTTGVAYRWQYQRPGNGKWYDTTMEGYNTDTLKVPATKTREGYCYRCVIVDARGGMLISEAATLYVDYRVRVADWDSSVVAEPGEKAQMKIVAVNAVYYQWQYQRPGSDKWFNTRMEGCNTPDLKVIATAARNGYKYRCIVRGVDGTEVISPVTVLTVE